MTWIFIIPITSCILLITLFPISSLSTFLFQTPLKISQFADLHFGEAPNLAWGPIQDINSTRVMNYILNSESPDFVVFSGDQITGNNIVNNATAVMRNVYSAVEEARVPFFSIFGNHDDQVLDPPNPRNSITTRTELLEFEKSTYPSLSQTCSNGCPNLLPSVSNYYQIITDPTGTPLVVLYFLDSGGGSYDEDLYTNITDWLQEITLELSNLTSLTFVHIPTPEYIAASINKDCIGTAEDGITPTVGINNLFQVLSNTGTSRGIFTGHDHGNSWCCPFLSMNLCFGRHTGYGGYGSWDRGSRILQISQNSSSINGIEIKTWIRMEDNTTNSLQWL